MTIDWKKYVDQIYCLTYTGQGKERTIKLMNELKRVDILDSGIYYEFENISTPIYEKIYHNFVHHDKYNYNYAFDCAAGHYYCMKHASQHNYNRILILESDCVFLKDKTLVELLMDKSLEILENDKNSLLVLNAIDSICPAVSFMLPKAFSINFRKTHNLYGAAFNIYSRNAYEQYINKFETFNILAPDYYEKIYGDDINIYENVVNICIQQNWVSYTIDSDVLFNINYEDDLKEYKNKKLELLKGFISSYSEVQKSIHEKGINSVHGEYIQYLHKLFDYYNKYFFDNKLNIEDYKLDYDHT